MLQQTHRSWERWRLHWARLGAAHRWGWGLSAAARFRSPLCGQGQDAMLGFWKKITRNSFNLLWKYALFSCTRSNTSKSTIYKIDHISKIKICIKKIMNKKSVSQHCLSFLKIRPLLDKILLFLVGNTRTWFRNANQWYLRTIQLERRVHLASFLNIWPLMKDSFFGRWHTWKSRCVTVNYKHYQP